MIARLLLLSCCCCLFAGLVPAQNSAYDVEHYTTENGLPQNSITGIEFDRKGYCWLGTEMGLVRFDGNQFKVFGFENIEGLKSVRVRSMGSDSRKNTYAMIDDGQIIATEVPDNGHAPRPRLLKNSKIWISVHNNFAAEPRLKLKAADSLVAAPKFSGVERLRILTRSGDAYLVIKNKTYYVDSGGLVLIDSQVRPYYRNHGVVADRLVLLQAGGRIKSWKSGIAQQTAILSTGPGSKNHRELTEANQLVVGSAGAYICAGKTIYEVYLENDKLKCRPLLEDIDIKDLFTVVYHAAQQKYYLGSLTAGLYVVTPSLFRYPPVPRQTMAEFRTQVAVEGGKGIICEQYLYHKDSCTRLPLSRQLGASAYADAEDNVYYGMTAELLKFNLKTRTNRKLFELDSRPMGIIRDRADSNSLLLATYFSAGRLCRDTLKDFRKVPGLKKGKAIWGCSQIGTDTLLLWTQEGLKWYDLKANRIFRSILDSMTIHSACADTGGRIWISTYGKGFFLYHDNKIIRLPSGPPDALNAIHSFIDDGRGYFWLPTNNGLYRTRKADLLAYAEGKIPAVYYYAFFTRNGLRTNEFNGNSLPGFVWLRDSMLSLLTIHGPLWFYPHRLPVVLPDQGIYIEQIRLGNTPVPWKKGPLVLPPDHGTLSVSVSSPYFGNRENMQLQFRIEGLDEAWHELPVNGEIMISRIPVGTYVLVLRKMTGREPGQYTRLALSIRVRPYWYDTWPFYLALFFLLALSVYQLVRLRTRVLQTRNRRLKTQVALQTRDLNRAVRQLTRSEDALKESNRAKDNIITTVLHDLRSPLRFLYTISKHVSGGHRAMPPEILAAHLEELKNSTASLNSFTDQFFTWAVSQHRSFAARYTTESLAVIFADAASLYTDIMGANGNRLIIEHTDLDCHTDPQLLSAVIRNLLDNANKNTRNGIIRLSAAGTGQEVKIGISDTGKGFTAEALRVFLNPDQAGPGSGKGSFIVLYLLGLIGGRLGAESAPGKGTAFTITLSRQHSVPGNTPGGSAQ